jgi:hypothetical protein
MKHIHVHTLLFMFVFCTSCGGQHKPDLSKDNSKSETKDVSTSHESDENSFHTKYEYTDSAGKRLIIQNSYPRGELYTDSSGKKYAKATFWTRISNETDYPFELKIDFSGDSYEFPSSVGRQFKIILPPDTMTRDKEDLINYGLTDLRAFLDSSINKPSSLKRTINPKKSSGFYVVRLAIVLESDGKRVKGDGNGVTRAGFSLKGQNLIYTLNGNEILCGRINMKNLILKKYTKGL